MKKLFIAILLLFIAMPAFADETAMIKKKEKWCTIASEQAKDILRYVVMGYEEDDLKEALTIVYMKKYNISYEFASNLAKGNSYFIEEVLEEYEKRGLSYKSVLLHDRVYNDCMIRSKYLSKKEKETLEHIRQKPPRDFAAR